MLDTLIRFIDRRMNRDEDARERAERRLLTFPTCVKCEIMFDPSVKPSDGFMPTHDTCGACVRHAHETLNPPEPKAVEDRQKKEVARVLDLLQQAAEVASASGAFEVVDFRREAEKQFLAIREA